MPRVVPYRFGHPVALHAHTVGVHQIGGLERYPAHVACIKPKPFTPVLPG